MSQNIPRNRMADPAPVHRMRPTSRVPGPQGSVPLTTDFTEHLAEGGYPDISEAGVAFAAMQRAEARNTDTRNATTTGPAAPGEISPGSGSQDRWAGVAQPTEQA